MRGRFPVSIGLALGLAACTPAEDAAQEDDALAPEPTESASTASAPDSFAETAWLALSEDGARYVTHFDADGSYRDMRNGDPYQEGSWRYAEGPEGKQLCFEPIDEGGVERCWLPGRLEEGRMIATGPAGRRIELTKIAYQPVAPEDETADDTAE